MTEKKALPQGLPANEIATAASSALILGYSAPMPGTDSRYWDGGVAHETRLLGVPTLSATLAGADDRSVGETVLEAVLGSRTVSGYADLRAAGHLAPLARAALLGERLGKVLAGLSYADVRYFARALEEAGPEHLGGTLHGALGVALGSGRDATLRDAMRFAAAGSPPDAMAAEYARSFEVTRTLARPALETALARVEAARPALVQAYLEVLAEIPDAEVERRAGRKEAEDVSRMAGGVVKTGGAGSRRGLQAIANLDGILKQDARLKPSATEAKIVAAAFLCGLDRGPAYLNVRVRPASQR
ncbi:MAG: triphosphoribosyl-dephospho-CoA synthase [Actinomycetota bacterium]|nr:triphosphoribosyl-dephospho-CoA synthase [Actinomycetota bacterium]